MARVKGISKNLNAFLDMLASASSEGTSSIKGSDDGYNVIVGGKLFDNGYIIHPNIVVQLNPKLKSSAAGRYQLLYRYYVWYKAQLKLPDFSPESQDKIAIQQIRERKALGAIEAGRLEDAIDACSNIWASLPGNSYGQHQGSLEALQKAFVNAGGTLA